MIKKLTITILVDNLSNTSNPDLLTEHGLSIWIEADDQKILFDTGQTDILLHNAKMQGIDLSSADTLVLSHGHYDHTGGVAEVLKCNPTVSVYCHPDIFKSRYSRQLDGRMKPVIINTSAANSLIQSRNAINWVTGPTQLSPDIGITGPIPRTCAFEDTGGAFFCDIVGKQPDLIEDDLAMWFRTVDGLIVITGCCHSGLVNTLSYVRLQNELIQMHTVLGGLHLLNASPERIKETCDYLTTAEIMRIVPCHCTGNGAVKYLQERFREKCIQGNVGFNF
jgi:7,8-dihydropterin-6-yl-methyl-4-(beta-D-ribofuranosyl)aminobenzene 5'-phosphate synthase